MSAPASNTPSLTPVAAAAAPGNAVAKLTSHYRGLVHRMQVDPEKMYHALRGVTEQTLSNDPDVAWKVRKWLYETKAETLDVAQLGYRKVLNDLAKDHPFLRRREEDIKAGLLLYNTRHGVYEPYMVAEMTGYGTITSLNIRMGPLKEALEYEEAVAAEKAGREAVVAEESTIPATATQGSDESSSALRRERRKTRARPY